VNRTRLHLLVSMQSFIELFLRYDFAHV
jgi:hypothetical protein